MKIRLNPIPGAVLLLLISVACTLAQTKNQILVDVAHGQKFYHDPTDMPGADAQFVDRVKYMTGELSKNASTYNKEVAFQKSAITTTALAKADMLFIHIPSARYTAEEVKAIQDYVNKGGSLFIVIEVDYWATLEQSSANEILKPYDIVFKADNPDQSSGGNTKPGKVASKKLSIPYHGARMVEGGTPFCFSNATENNPFGVYKELKGGGKIVAMGDGMVSLYMTSWEGVDNYQCSEFMNDVFAFLLK